MRKVKPQSPYQWSLPNSKVPFLAPDVITKVIPSPVEGWDAISPLAEMDPKRAPILNNWVPRPGYVELRGGYIPFAGLAGQTTIPIETLMVYRPPGTNAMFAAAGSQIYDVSDGGGGISVLTGLNSARWQYTNFTPPDGTTVIQACNGVDELIQWNGTSWSNPAITNLPSGSTTSIVNISAQKQRLWFCLNNSTVVAFMPTGAITGAIAGTQDFGELWSKGGYLMAIADWTIDGGSGPNDYMAFISSWGQISLYAGTDPTNASTWSLVGTFDTAPPIGRRCVLRIGSDVAIITQQGVIPISQALPFDPSADRSVAITARIQNAMAASAQQYQNNFGWELSVFPNEQLLILNVPQSENVQQVQYVMSTLVGSWCQFTGWNANCFAVYNNNLYWGSNTGTVNQGYVGGSDFTTSIQADMQCAFNWLDEPGRTKRMTMVQPLLTSTGGITPTMAVDTDFMTSTAVAPISILTGTTLWDVSMWDVAVWGGGTVNYDSFLSVQAVGHALAIRMRVNVVANMTAETSLFDVAQFDISEFDTELDPTVPVLQVNAFNSIAELGGAI
jgi:hypothetical protein